MPENARWREVGRTDVGWPEKKGGIRFWLQDAAPIELAVLFDEGLHFAQVFEFVRSEKRQGWRMTARIVPRHQLPGLAEVPAPTASLEPLKDEGDDDVFWEVEHSPKK